MIAQGRVMMLPFLLGSRSNLGAGSDGAPLVLGAGLLPLGLLPAGAGVVPIGCGDTGFPGLELGPLAVGVAGPP